MKVKFLPQNIEVEVDPGKSLLQIATENQLEIRSICKGVPSCAECRVKIVSGENNMFPPNKAELNLIGTSYYIDSRRLSCQVKCFGDLVVDLTEQVERSETQSKKVRGYRSPKHQESHAVQDTMILKEPSAPSTTSSSVSSDAGEWQGGGTSGDVQAGAGSARQSEAESRPSHRSGNGNRSSNRNAHGNNQSQNQSHSHRNRNGGGNSDPHGQHGGGSGNKAGQNGNRDKKRSGGGGTSSSSNRNQGRNRR